MSARNRILITDRFDAQALSSLKSDASLEVAVSHAPQPTSAELAMTQALIIRSRTKINTELLNHAPELKVVVTATSGFDHIDFDATHARGIRVMFTPNANAASAAELTWALVLACARRLPESQRAVKAGDWKRELLVGRQLEGKTLGVIGLGRIGQRVARFGHAFGMKVLAFDPYKETETFTEARATRLSLDELFRLSDVVCVHVPATLETDGMINANLLDAASDGLIFVNTSRGSIVREKDLLTALHAQRLGACGLDVFEKEPLSRNSELLSHANVVLTPHIGATTSEAFAAASAEAAEKVRSFFTTGAVSDSLPPMEPWWEAMMKRPFGN